MAFHLLLNRLFDALFDVVFVVLRLKRRAGDLVDEFDRLYGGRLSKIPVWRDWVAGLEFLDPKAAAALSGTLNLHDYETRIDALADTYEQLRRASIH